MTAAEQVPAEVGDDEWPDVAVPGTVDPAELVDMYPREDSTPARPYWVSRPHQPRLGHLPAGQAAVTSLADWKRRRGGSTEGSADTE